jgi:hypothetical protein
MVKYEKTGIVTGITTKDKKEYMKRYKRKYNITRRANVRYLFCNTCGGKYTNEHVGWHKKMKKHIRAEKYLEENDDFQVPTFESINMDEFYWKEDF